MVVYICFVLLIIFLVWFKMCLSSIESDVSSISYKLISSLDRTDLSNIERHLSSIDAKLSNLKSLDSDRTDLLDIESHLSSVDAKLNDLSSLESDVSSIKEDLSSLDGSSFGDSIKDKLDEIIVKLEELIEKR